MSHTRGGSVGEGNVVRKSSKRSRIILGAAVASALAGMTASSVRAVNYSWNGTAGGPSFWDVNTNWAPNTGFPGAVDNATFGAGAVDFGVNLHAIDQAVNNVAFTNAAGSYQLSNGTLNIGGALTQSGAATNTIGAAVNASSAWTISAGTLALTNLGATSNNFNSGNITVGAGATLSSAGGYGGFNSATHNATVTLSGGTLRANGVSSGQNALLSSYYPGAINQGNAAQKFARLAPDLQSGDGLLTLTPAGSNLLQQSINFSDQGQGGFPSAATDIRTASGGLIAGHEDFAVAWSGSMHVSAADAGVWNFVTRSDDGSVIWIDLNNNGTFDFNAGDPATTELIVNNNFDQGPTVNTDQGNPGANRPVGHPNPNLAAGDYKIVIGWFEGRVTGEVQAGFLSPTHTGNPADPATYAAVNPGDPGQAGLWSFSNTGNLKYRANYLTTAVAVAAGTNSTVNVDALGADFGALSIGGGSTLNTTGTGPATFTSTNATGNVTFNTAVNTSTGRISGAVTKLTKTGAATLSIEDLSGASSFTAGNTVSVVSGVLRARSDGTSNTISSAGGGATISLDGGTFAATTSGVVSSPNALRAQYYTGGDNPANLDPISTLITRVANHENLLTGPLSMADRGGVPGAPGDIRVISDGFIPESGDGAQNYNVLWTGHLNITPANAGRYFFNTTSDDGSIIYIDLDRDGTFNADAGEIIVNNNAYQGPTTRDNNNTAVFLGHGGHPDLDLNPGSYPIAIGWYEGGGGAQMTARISGPATGNNSQVINPSAQPGLYNSLDTTTVANFSSSPVVVTADSSIDVQADHALFGDLTIGGGRTLTFPGVGGAVFASTHASGTINIVNNAFSDVTTGPIFATGAVTINKSGLGGLVIDNTSGAAGTGLTAGSAINLTGGSLTGTHNGTVNSLGLASISLANTALQLGSASATGAVTYNNVVSASGNATVFAGNVGSGSLENKSVNLSTLNVANGSNVNLFVRNGYSLTVAQSNLAGNASFTNNSADTGITLGNISGVASSVLNMNGANRTRITGNITGNNVIINAPGVDYDPGTGNTRTSSANTQINTNLRIASGIVNYNNQVISGNPAHFQAGLLETFANGGFYEGSLAAATNTFGVPQSIQLTTRRANQAAANTTAALDANGWADNTTYIYSGQILIPDNGVAGDGIGHVAFGARFDDNFSLKIDGVQLMRDTNWDNATASGDLALSAGWHDIDVRFGEGGGGVGGNSGAGGEFPAWAANFPDGTPASFGYQDDPSLGFDPTSAFNGATGAHTSQAKYHAPKDNGTMNLFRTLVPVGGSLDIDSGSELKVGGLTTLASVNLNGSTGLAKLTLNNHATASNSDVVNLNLLNGGSGEVNVGLNTTLTTNNLVIDTSGSTFTKSGPGVLRISTAANLQSTVIVTAGKVQFNGTSTGTGGVDVQSGAAVGGSGTITGNVNIQPGGSLSPHDGGGTATLTIADSLALNPLSKLDFNFNGVGDSVNVLNALNLTGNTTLNINAITGFTVGTYRLFTATAYDPLTGDVVIGANNGPGAFNYSIVETAPSGTDAGHIDLIVTSQTMRWTGNTDSIWDINNKVNWQTPPNTTPPFANPAKYIDLTAVVLGNSYVDPATGNPVNIANRNLNITAASVAPASITVNNDAAHNYSIGGNPITGPTGILKQGAGDLSLTGTNTFIGPVSIEGGSVTVNALANGGVASPLGQGTLPVSLGSASTAGTLAYTGAAAGLTDRGLIVNAGGGGVNAGAAGATIGGVVSGAGAFTKTGAGTLTLSNVANTNSGSITVGAGTLSVASLGNGDPGANINVNGNTFEYTGPNRNGTRGVTSTGGTIGVTNANTNLALAGPVSGTTLGKSGPGTLTLSGPVTYSGAAHSIGANSGTVAYNNAANTINGTYGVETGSTLRSVVGGLGTVAVSLNGGTLSLQGDFANRGLKGDFLQFAPGTAILDTIDALNQAVSDNSATQYATANTGLSDLDPRPFVQGAINHIAGPGNPFDQYGGISPPVNPPFDNLVARWTGKIHIGSGQGGLTQFFTNSDDGSKLWIDGVEVVNNNFFQGTTERGGSIDLTPGDHDVVIGYYEGGGDASMVLSWTPVGGTKQVVPNSVLFGSGASANYGNNVSTAPGLTSSINVGNVAVANMGALNFGNGSTLNVTAGSVAFTGSTLPVAGGTYNVGGDGEINLKQVSVTGGGAATLNHAGNGTMILETANLPGLGAGSVINMAGGTLGGVGDAAATNPFGQAAINLSSGAGLLLSNRTGDVTYNSAVSGSGTVRIGSTVLGSGTVGPHSMILGSAAKPLTLANGSTVALSSVGNTTLVVPAVQLTGDATFNNNSNSASVRIGNISGGGVATFGGSNQITLTGNVTGATPSVVVRGNALNVDPGAAGTSNVGGPIKVVSTLNAKSGTLNVGNNIISGQTATSAVAGLNEYAADGSFYEGAIAGRPNRFNVPDSIQLEPRRAQMNGGTINDPNLPPGQGGNAPGWADNLTYIYSGQILVPDNGTPLDGRGSVAFFMRFDDSISLKIDGQTIMRDTTWNNATSSGEVMDPSTGNTLPLTSGWHDIEMRFGEGGGGVGANWQGPALLFADGTPAAVGFQTDPSLTFDANSGFDGTGNAQNVDITKYFAPRDDGTMNMFRIAAGSESGTVNIANGGTVVAGGVDKLQALNLAGNTHLNLSNTAAHTGTVVRMAATGAVGESNSVNLGANNTLNVQQLTVAAGTTFNKDGAGTLRITDTGAPTAAFLVAHNFENDSTVKVNAGKFIVNSTGLTGTGSVLVANNATLGGKGSITGSVTVSAGGHVAPGDGVGTLTVGGLSLTNSRLDLEGGATGLDQLKLGNDGSTDVLTLSGNNVITLFDLGGVASGDYVILDQNNLNPIANPSSFFSIANPGAFGGTASLFTDANKDVVLHLDGVQPNPQWIVDASGNWSVSSNWTGGVPTGPTAVANFLGAITAPRTVTLDGSQTVQNINFNNANKYTIGAGSGTLTVNAGNITVTAGSHEISAPLSLIGAVTKSGPGTLTISGTQSNTAGSSLAVTQGVVNLNSNAGGGTAASSPLALNINGSGGGSTRVNLGANQDLSSLTITTGDANSQTLDLASPAGAGQFHQVQVYASNLTAAKASLYTAIVNTQAAGALDPLDGIIDSGLHAGAKIGLAQIGDHISIRAVRVGDLNLDGQVTISDFIDLASNFNTVGTATWQEGDLNYDRNVTISDFIDLASNFNGTYAGGAGAINSEDVQLLASFAQSYGVDPSVIGSAVPEPGTLSLLAIGAMGLMSRRRRKA